MGSAANAGVRDYVISELTVLGLGPEQRTVQVPDYFGESGATVEIRGEQGANRLTMCSLETDIGLFRRGVADGDPGSMIPHIEPMVTEAPLDERLNRILMRALY